MCIVLQLDTKVVFQSIGRFTEVLKRLGFSQVHFDHTMFYRHFQEGKAIILIFYVDDIILTSKDDLGMNRHWLMNSK